MFGPLAQLVEHKTFNLGVPGSSPGWATKDTICSGILENEINMLISFFYCLRKPPDSLVVPWRFTVEQKYLLC